MHIRTMTKSQPKCAGIETVLDTIQQLLSIVAQGLDIFNQATGLMDKGTE